jgi:hypothetical protein
LLVLVAGLLLVLRAMKTSGNTLKKLVRTAAPVLAGAALALTGAAATADAAPAPEPTAVSAFGPQVSSCFANRNDVPFYSYLAWANYREIIYDGKIGQGQGLYWTGVTTVNGYTYVVGNLWGGPRDVMIPKMYMNCP